MKIIANVIKIVIVYLSKITIILKKMIQSLKYIYFNCYINPKGYYLYNNALYNLCYKKCKSCDSEGSYIIINI